MLGSDLKQVKEATTAICSNQRKQHTGTHLEKRVYCQKWRWSTKAFCNRDMSTTRSIKSVKRKSYIKLGVIVKITIIAL